MKYLCDIDGTLADLSHRLHFIQREPPAKPDWDGFFGACGGDKPIPEVIQTIQLLSHAGATIILMSGRSDSVRQKTIDWLYMHCVPWSSLLMRKHGDHRPDNIVKSELLDDVVLRYWNLDEITGVFEDRDQVVEMYRSRGLRVFQVAKGDF